MFIYKINDFVASVLNWTNLVYRRKQKMLLFFIRIQTYHIFFYGKHPWGKLKTLHH